MQNRTKEPAPNYESPRTFEPYFEGDRAFEPFDPDDYDYDDENLADGYGAPAALPIEPFTEDDLRFLRDFILGTAMYVEQLEAIANEQSDEFWQAREHAYRIITAVLIRHYEYVLEIE